MLFDLLYAFDTNKYIIKRYTYGYVIITYNVGYYNIH